VQILGALGLDEQPIDRNYSLAAPSTVSNARITLVRAQQSQWSPDILLDKLGTAALLGCKPQPHNGNYFTKIVTTEVVKGGIFGRQCIDGDYPYSIWCSHQFDVSGSQ
jgi:hypothetical protein